MKPYERGTIKVVWLDKDPERIYSKMFDSVEEATVFTKDLKDFIVFSLVSQEGMETFEWKLLPFGQHSLYIKAVRIYQNNKEHLLKLIKTFLP